MRRLAREDVFKLVFEYTFYGVRNDGTLELLLVDSGLDEDDKKYINDTYDGIVTEYESLKEMVSSHLEGYVLDRVYRPDLAVMILAAYELKLGSVPAPVIISEAVGLAKKYGDTKSGSFVNGVLAKISRDEEAFAK